MLCTIISQKVILISYSFILVIPSLEETPVILEYKFEHKL